MQLITIIFTEKKLLRLPPSPGISQKLLGNQQFLLLRYKVVFAMYPNLQINAQKEAEAHRQQQEKLQQEQEKKAQEFENKTQAMVKYLHHLERAKRQEEDSLLALQFKQQSQHEKEAYEADLAVYRDDFFTIKKRSEKEGEQQKDL